MSFRQEMIVSKLNSVQ